MFLRRMNADMVSPDQALPGRPIAMPVADRHEVLGTPLKGPFPEGLQVAVFGMGCFWGAERLFWTLPGVYTTSAGYAGGITKNPTYEETCSGRTGHAEVVQVVYDPSKINYEDLLKVFWENHDPTQGMRQGNDVGTQYRSAIYTTTDEQRTIAESSRDAFQPIVTRAGKGEITTEIAPLGSYYFAEDYHQQYAASSSNVCSPTGCGLRLDVNYPG
ncbi:peptide-methionine (S)-S-oxide reductase MsrA [Micromonospora salmantinae]|uniref:peptide-methionine (S)-S-oxide reductase MsrA n=1 Tax=Micromonospora salmantinae TaxID=2911211 RepID=UPI0027DF5E15|nr:peptide-methionine (S)-S-oxide reductase MsrA [Micromonospora salmantinae]